MQPHIIRRNVRLQHSQLATLDAQHSSRVAGSGAGSQHDSGADGDCRLIAHAQIVSYICNCLGQSKTVKECPPMSSNVT